MNNERSKTVSLAEWADRCRLLAKSAREDAERAVDLDSTVRWPRVANQKQQD